jgi:hypothetical protein
LSPTYLFGGRNNFAAAGLVRSSPGPIKYV